ncbi:MAG: hypothetical protein ACYDHZ_05025 [Dehalococcoidia bacterium]|jgi:hypothetical protein
MNSWLKIGLPVLVAVLLVVAAVSVTLAVTGANSRQVATSYNTAGTNVQYVSGPYGPGYVCPPWRSAASNGPGGWCWGRY